jgi:hypothetical protein
MAHRLTGSPNGRFQNRRKGSGSADGGARRALEPCVADAEALRLQRALRAREAPHARNDRYGEETDEGD